jgi:hypothetical protein
LYGPILLVDPATRTVVANEPDGEGLLHPDGELRTGTLPASVPLANSPTEWSGKRWTMLLWPLPPQPVTRHVMLAHEMFHRIQPQLGIPMEDSLCAHLDSLQGRLWLQLEWRALAAALVTHGAAQTAAVRDALAFRDHRHELFPGSAALEANQEIAEGVPEYTGTVAGTPDADAARWRTIGRLSDPDGDSLFVFQGQGVSFVRAFAYVSGPAYGLLLDERLPGWRARVARHASLGALLATTVPAASPPVSTIRRAALYGESAIRLSENERAARMEAEKARYRALLVEGPTLHIRTAGHFRFTFNPSAMVSLGQEGVVSPTFHGTDDWGTLDVREGVLLASDYGSATLAAPADTAGTHIQGQGWTLDLAPGWHVVPGASPGSFTLHKD